jgi:hypothetical protein
MTLKELRDALKPLAKSLADAIAELEDEADGLTRVASRPVPPLMGADAKKAPFAEQNARERVDHVRTKLADAQAALAQIEALLPSSTSGGVTTVVAPTSTGAPAATTSTAAAAAGVPAPTSGKGPSAMESASADRWGFAAFLGSVGESIVNAQRRLDDESERYVTEQLNREGRGVPAMFRIPKLSAEIKFALTKEGEKGLNLLLFSDKQKSSEQHQQSMSFDIVAMPPPPEVIRDVRLAVPRLEVLLDPAERARIFECVAKVKATKMLEVTELLGDASRPETENLEKVRDYVVIVPAQVNGAETSRKQFFLFQADEAEEHFLGIWFLDMDPTEPKLEPVYRFSAKPKAGENIVPFKTWITKVGDSQAEILKKLRPNA